MATFTDPPPRACPANGVADRRRDLRWMDSAARPAVVAWVLMAAVMVLGTVLALQSACNGAAFPDNWHRLLTAVTWVLLLPISGAAWGALQAQRSVWHARVAPGRALRSARRAFSRTLAVSLALAVLPLALIALLAPPLTSFASHGFLVTALMTGTLSLGLIAAAAWRGQIRATWAWPGLLALLALSPALLGEEGWAQWQQPEGWRNALLVAFLASPGLAAWLTWPHCAAEAPARPSPWRALLAEPHSGRGSEDGLRGRLLRLKARASERFRLLDKGGLAGAMSGFSWQLPQQIINGRSEGLLFMPWGSEITPLDVYRWLLLALVPLALTSSPSLHWRHLLAPGGALRHQLGAQIATTTFVLVVTFMGSVTAAIGLGVLLLADDGSARWHLVPLLVARYGPALLLELALATMLATTLRGFAGSSGRAVFALLALGTGWGVVHGAIYLLSGEARVVLGHRDEVWVAAMLLAVAALWPLAGRAWRRTDLAALLRNSRRTAGEERAP